MYSGYERYAARASRRIPMLVLCPIAEPGSDARAA
jgi:hypothetical protein